MNENDKPRSERRRSSRRGRRGSGGGDRPAQGTPSNNQAASPQPQNSRQNPPQRSGRGGGQGRNERNGREKQERAARTAESSGQGGQGRRNRSGGRGAQGGQVAQAAQPRAPQPPRERFNSPKPVAPVLPKPLCPRCGAAIEDLPSAMTDKETGEPVHFDCILARLAESENLGEGEKIVYLGGGRFGVVHFDNPSDLKHFRVRKTLQWEEKEKRADWRRTVTDLYSST